MQLRDQLKESGTTKLSQNDVIFLMYNIDFNKDGKLEYQDLIDVFRVFN